jgi:uncharacterized protein
MEEVSFKDSKGNQIIGNLVIPKEAKSVVIISHGFTSNKDKRLYVELQNELTKAGIGTLRYEYYGHGPVYCKDSKYTVAKDITLTKCVDSLKTAISFVRSKGDYNISLMGSSFGGLISLIAASQDSKIQALVLKSSVTEPIEFWKERLDNDIIEKWKQDGVMHYNKRGENLELNYEFWEDLLNYNTFKMAINITCPVLMIHGDSDTVVPIKQSQDLAKIVKTEVNVVKGANHGYATTKQYNEMKKLITDFLIMINT